MLKRANKLLCRVIIVFCVILFCTFVLSLNDGKKRKLYNMNVSESLKLASIYDNDNVNWETSNDNVTLSYDSVIANKPGKAVISALDNDGNELFKASIKVLGSEELAVDNHNVNLKLKQNKKIVVNNDSNVSSNDNLEDFEEEYEEFSDYEMEDDLDSVVTDEEKLESYVEYSYNSSNEEVVTVDDNGNLEPVSSGNAVVTVNDNAGNTDYVYVTVDDDDIDFYSYEYSLDVGDAVCIDYSLNSIAYGVEDISWSSDNTNVVVVDGNGCVTAVSNGSTYITVKVGDDIEKKILINVLDNTVLPEDLDLSTYNVDIRLGDIFVINGVVYPYSANNKSVSWYSNNESVVEVNNGVVKAVGVGEAIVTATTENGIKKEVIVVVRNKQVDVESINCEEHIIDIKVGDVKKVNYTIFPVYASDKKVKYVYDKEYLSVDDDGNVKAIKPGLTYLSIVTSNGKQDEIMFDIYEELSPVSIELEKKEIEMFVGDVNTIKAKVVNKDDEGELVYSSSDSKVVEVMEDGSLKAIASGKAIITISLKGDESIKANCYVVVKEQKIEVADISLSNNYIDLVVGDNKILISSVIPNNSTNKNINWISSNPAVATVNNGNVVAVGAGSAVIRVISVSNPSVYKECIVNVKNKVINVSKLSISKKSLKLTEGNSSKIKATISPKNATNRNIKWISSNPAVVTVSNGNVVAVGAGNAVISAVSESNPSLVANCNVKVIKKVTEKEKFIKSLEKMSKQVRKDKKNGKSWSYAGTRRGTFNNARKNGRTLDCALYVSYALVDVGVLDSNSRFFKRKENKIAYDGSAKSKMHKHLTYIDGNGKKAATLIKEGKLQKGDIVLWYKQQHTNVYAGDKKWYDGGRWRANGASSATGGKFKTLGPVSIEDLNKNWKVWKILRFKN